MEERNQVGEWEDRETEGGGGYGREGLTSGRGQEGERGGGVAEKRAGSGRQGCSVGGEASGAERRQGRAGEEEAEGTERGWDGTGREGRVRGVEWSRREGRCREGEGGWEERLTGLMWPIGVEKEGRGRRSERARLPGCR